MTMKMPRSNTFCHDVKAGNIFAGKDQQNSGEYEI